MKRILFIIIAFIGGITSGYAREICVKTNTYIGTLRAGVGTYEYNPDSTIKSWKVEFDFDNNHTVDQTITGLASCNGISGTYGVVNTGLFTDAVDVGTKCWCKMEPVKDAVLDTYSANGEYATGITSYWVYLKDYSGYSNDENTNEDFCAGLTSAQQSAHTSSPANPDGSCASECARMFSNNNNETENNSGLNNFQQKIFEAVW